jgi:hypothetical protein
VRRTVAEAEARPVVLARCDNGLMTAGPDDDRYVDMFDDDLEVLPDQTSDDTDVGWGERPPDDDDARYERPPHW